MRFSVVADDATVSAAKGPGFPVMNVNERALNVLGMHPHIDLFAYTYYIQMSFACIHV